MKKKQLFTLLAISALACLALCACGDKDEAKGPLSFADKNGSYTLIADDTWSDMSGQWNDEADIEIGNEKQEKYIIVLEENKEDLAMNLEEYFTITSGQFETILTDMKETASGQTEKNGMPAYYKEVEESVDKINIHYWLYGVEGDQHFTQVIGWTLKSTIDKNRADIETVLKSFQPQTNPQTEPQSGK